MSVVYIFGVKHNHDFVTKALFPGYSIIISLQYLCSFFHVNIYFLTRLDMDRNSDFRSTPRNDWITLGYKLNVSPIVGGGDADFYLGLGGGGRGLFVFCGRHGRGLFGGRHDLFGGRRGIFGGRHELFGGRHDLFDGCHGLQDRNVKRYRVEKK